MPFEARPLVFPARARTTLVIRPCFPLRLSAEDTYAVCIRPFSGIRRLALSTAGQHTDPALMAQYDTQHTIVPAEGALSLPFVFVQEDRYAVTVYVNGQEVQTLEVCALEADLFARLPFKGDNHLHTFFSDGTESPEYVAASCRRLGYDYVAITDHHHYSPSLRARDFFAPLGLDFTVLPGEEVHAPDNPVHIINLGGTEGVNRWWREDAQGYEAAVSRHLRGVSPALAPNDRAAVASCLAVFERIQEVDGASILCHPGWVLGDVLNEPLDITDALFERPAFDALELIAGGAYEEGTQLQISYYQAREALPVVGSSDSHRMSLGRLSPGNYTIVFAKSLAREDLVSAVREGYTVAARGQKLYGPYRLVSLAYFYLHHVFPDHDARCERQGKALVGYACGKAEAKPECVQQLREMRTHVLDGYADLKAPEEGARP